MTTYLPNYEMERLLTSLGPGASKPAGYVVVLTTINRTLLATMLAVVLVGMGCVVTVDDFRVVCRRPVGAFIGFGCQFVILPLTAFTLAHILDLKPAFALGMLIAASSPGGVASNLFTYWSVGDVCLSIVMTTVSTVAAMGMLPFNLWLYSRSWAESKQAVIPYRNIIIGLTLIIIPVGIGMIIRWKSAKAARIVTMVGSICGLVTIVVNLTINVIVNPGIFSAPWTLWLAAALLPCCGYCSGYVFAWLLCQKAKQRRTISFETGSQNIAIALALIAITFYDSPMFFDLFVFPSIFGLAVMTEAMLLVIVYRVYDKKCKMGRIGENKREDEVEPKLQRYTKKDDEVKVDTGTAGSA